MYIELIEHSLHFGVQKLVNYTSSVLLQKADDNHYNNTCTVTTVSHKAHVYKQLLINLKALNKGSRNDS